MKCSCYPLNTVVVAQCLQKLFLLPSEHCSYYTVPSGTYRVTLWHSSCYTVPSWTDRVNLWTQELLHSSIMNWSCYPLNTVVITQFHHELIVLPSEQSSYYTVSSGTVVLPYEHSSYYTVPSGTVVLSSEHSSYYTVPSWTDRATTWAQ